VTKYRLRRARRGQDDDDDLRVYLEGLGCPPRPDAVCGAAYGTTSPDRVNRRNGYRAREFDTRAGTLELAIYPD
jgi:hypothetical protein